ncbi:hypothetical protein T06_15390 [Trichinella sp. T6]|nr:hypothetical protein T06_15390 [Trichinella sp. T6]
MGSLEQPESLLSPGYRCYFNDGVAGYATWLVQHASQQSENSRNYRTVFISPRHKLVTALSATIDVISSSFETAALSTGSASPPIEYTNGLTSNIPLLAVFAGTHPPAHIISVIRRMKMIV